MKYAVLVGDGMADRPMQELDNKTPLEVAKIPNMDFIAKHGRVGLAYTVPEGFPPASDVANLSVIGYDPVKYYAGRGPLEAANMGIKLGENDIAFRCNFVTVLDDAMIDYSAGHIKTKEADFLINDLNKKLSSEKIKFYTGISYRHLMVIEAGTENGGDFSAKCTPPHDIVGKKIKKFLPKGEGEEVLNKLMQDSIDILAKSDINKIRIDLKENPANMIWLWGQGKNVKLPLFKERYGLDGGVISAVNLIKGIGRIIGLDVIDVPGATGYYDTNYSGKAEYALNCLKEKDFVFVHVEAPDEAGHNGDTRMKISSIESFDKLVVGPILNEAKKGNFRILVMPDHPTPISLKTHSSEAVLFAMYGTGIEAGSIGKFSEEAASVSKFIFKNASEIMSYLIKQ